MKEERSRLNETINKKPIILEKSMMLCMNREDYGANVVDRLLSYGDKVKESLEEKK